MNKHGWTYKKLGDCFSYIKNGANIKQIKNAQGLPITRIETLSGGIFNRNRLGYADIFDEQKYSSYYLNNHDILMSHINSKQYIGRAVLYQKLGDEKIIHGMNLLRLVPIKDIIFSPFIVYYFSSIDFKRNIARIRKDAVNQSSFTTSDLKNIHIPVPPMAEQQAIVAELDEINEAIAEMQQQIADLDMLAQATFYDMFGDPEKNPYGYESMPLENMCLLKAGKAVKANQLSDKPEGRYPCFGGNGIRGYIENYSHNGIYPIIGRQGALCGNINLAKGQFYATEHAVVVSPIKRLAPLWLFYALQQMHLEQYAHGVAQPGLSVKDLNPLDLYYPPLSLQQEFAAKVEAIESAKAELNAQIAEMQTLLASRMDYYFD